MPSRAIVTKEMADLLGVLAHPHRIRIVEELQRGELDVNSLQAILGVTHSRVSQHLSVMRARRVVAERRQGRFVLYRLRKPRLAVWMVEGFEFLAGDPQLDLEIREAVEQTRPPLDLGGAAAAKPQRQDREA